MYVVQLIHQYTVKIIYIYYTIQQQPNAETSAENLKVAPVNNLLHSMFNQINVFVNQKLVSPPNNVYSYRAYEAFHVNSPSVAQNSAVFGSFSN